MTYSLGSLSLRESSSKLEFSSIVNMNLIWKVAAVLALLATFGTTCQGQQEQIIDYVVSLIRHLSDTGLETFDCWFYATIEQSSDDSILEAIFISKQLSMVPRRMLFSQKEIDVDRSPGLLVIDITEIRYPTFHNFLYSSFEREMKIIVLFNLKTIEKAQIIGQALTNMYLYNVVYIRTDFLTIHHSSAYQVETIARVGAIPLEEVFIDPIRNLTGHTFLISYSMSLAGSDWNSKSRHGFEMEIIGDTITRLGGYYNIHRIRCEEGSSLEDCMSYAFFYNATTVYDFCLNALTRKEMVNDIYTYSTIPNTMIIVAPSGQRRTSLELFTIPFQKELWFALLVLKIICILAMQLCPKWFHNDLILLPLCGFERRQFHQVSALEKTLLIVLIVIYFILSKSYETKIVAFMTDYPYEADPQTLEDLLKSKLTIKQFDADFERSMIDSNPEMKNLFATVKFGDWESIDWYSRKHAYIGSEAHMHLCMQNPKNIDPETGHRRMVIVNQVPLGNRISFFFTSFRNPLVPKLKRVEMQFFEAGFYSFWLHELTRQTFGLRHVYMSKGYIPEQKNIGLQELLPAWYALGFGWLLGFMFLALEVVWDIFGKFAVYITIQYFYKY